MLVNGRSPLEAFLRSPLSEQLPVPLHGSDGPCISISIVSRGTKPVKSVFVYQRWKWCGWNVYEIQQTKQQA